MRDMILICKIIEGVFQCKYYGRDSFLSMEDEKKKLSEILIIDNINFYHRLPFVLSVNTFF